MERLIPRRRFFGIAAVFAATACAREADGAPGATVRQDLYQCEGCEGAYDRPAPSLPSTARIGPESEPGEPMVIEGIVYATDGVTPAPGVVIYAYQTNNEGLYAGGAPGTEASRRHGRLRGWAKTDSGGRYRFLTVKPAPYPNDVIPAHVHFTVLEPGRRPYWIDDIVFDGEFGVTTRYRAERENRGGDGIVRLERTADGVLLARRNIRLERHPG